MDQLVGTLSQTPKGHRFVLGRGTCPGCRVNPWLGRAWVATDRCFSLSLISIKTCRWVRIKNHHCNNNNHKKIKLCMEPELAGAHGRAAMPANQRVLSSGPGCSYQLSCPHSLQAMLSTGPCEASMLPWLSALMLHRGQG